MSKISYPTWCLFAIALLLGINLSLQSARADDTGSAIATDSARPDNCLTAPPVPMPKGEHWYYRTDRQNGRKCWSLHATPLVHHAAARPQTKTATSATNKKPAAPAEVEPPPPTSTQEPVLEFAAPPSPPTDALPAPEAASVAAPWPAPTADAAPDAAAVPFAGAPPPGPADGVQPQPHVEILRTEPVGAPAQQQAAQPSAPAAQVAPDAQAAQPSAPAAQGGTTTVDKAMSTDSADTVPSNTGSAAKDAAVPEAGPDAERGKSDVTQQEPAATPSLADTIATLQPTELFFLLAIGLSAVVFLVAIASRIAAMRREPIITEYSDSAWRNDRIDPRRLEAPQFADEAMDEQWTDQEQNVPFIDPQGPDDPHEEQRWIEQPALTRKSAAAFSAPSAPDPKSLEPVLRILRQS